METTLIPKNETNQNEIARLARQLWEKEGCPSGRDLDFWLKAETQLQSSRNPTAVRALPAEAKPKVAVAGKKYNGTSNPMKMTTLGPGMKERALQ